MTDLAPPSVTDLRQDEEAVWPAEARERIRSLREALERVTTEREDARRSVTTAATNHRRDLEHVSEWLNTHAERKGWCASYDEYVREMTEGLTQPDAWTHRERPWDIQVPVMVSVRIGSIMARDEESAIDYARECFTGMVTDEAVEALREGFGFTIEWDEAEAEEADT